MYCAIVILCVLFVACLPWVLLFMRSFIECLTDIGSIFIESWLSSWRIVIEILFNRGDD